MILKKVRPRLTMLLYFLIIFLFGIPGVASAGTGIQLVDNAFAVLMGIGAFALFILVLIKSIQKLWEHHMMGLGMIILVAIIIIIATHTDLMMQFAQGLSSKLGLTWFSNGVTP